MTSSRVGPSYRSRLHVEGWSLAGCGLVGSLLLVLLDARTTQNGLSTVLQLAAVGVLLAVFGPRSVRRAVAAARSAEEIEATGEPTPLWHLPLVTLVLASPFVALGAWDAALRVTGGCVLVGLAQAVVLGGVLTAAERASGRRFYRAPGSRLLRGTRLAYVESPGGDAALP
jgi:hypothetical protein